MIDKFPGLSISPNFSPPTGPMKEMIPNTQKGRRKKESNTDLSHGIDIDVIFLLALVRHKWLDQEVPENSLHTLDINLLGCTLLNPFPGLRPSLVQGQQPQLPSPLDQLIWFGNESSSGSEEKWVCGLRCIENSNGVTIWGEVEVSKLWRGVVRWWGKR